MSGVALQLVSAEVMQLKGELADRVFALTEAHTQIQMLQLQVRDLEANNVGAAVFLSLVARAGREFKLFWRFPRVAALARRWSSCPFIKPFARNVSSIVSRWIPVRGTASRCVSHH